MPRHTSSTKSTPILIPEGLTYCRTHKGMLPTPAFVPSTLSLGNQRGVCKACWSEYMRSRRNGNDNSPLRMTPSELAQDVQALYGTFTELAEVVHGIVQDLLATKTVSIHTAQHAAALPQALNVLGQKLGAVQAAAFSESLKSPSKPYNPRDVTSPLPAEFEALDGDPGASNPAQTRTNVGSDGLSNEDRAEMDADASAFYEAQRRAAPPPPSDAPLPSAARTEDEYAKEKSNAEAAFEAEQLALAARTVSPALPALLDELALSEPQPEPPKPLEIVAPKNATIQDIDPEKEDF